MPPVYSHPHAKAHVRDLSPVYGHANKEVHVKASSYAAVAAAAGGMGGLNSDAYDNTPAAVRPEAAPSRTEALLLRDAYERMMHNVRSRVGGEDLNVLARQVCHMCVCVCARACRVYVYFMCV